MGLAMECTDWSPKDIVRKRSGNMCEKCGVNLDRNVQGKPESIRARSIHHRQPRRSRGRDSVVCMVNLCLGCHRAIHDDEDAASRDGWIVLGQTVGRVPFLSWRGWVLPDAKGGLTLLSFEIGRAELIPAPEPPPRGRRDRATSRRSRRALRVA